METMTSTASSINSETTTTTLSETTTFTQQTATTTIGINSVAVPTSSQKSSKILPIDVQNDQKRRSSSRSIKRKRFDDEIVEYSTTFPQNRGASEQNRGARQRTTSQTYVPVPAAVLPQLLQPPTNVPAESSSASTTPATIATTVPELVPGILTSSSTALNATAGTHPALSPLVPIVPPHSTLNMAERSTASEQRRRPPRANNNKRARRTGRPPSQLTTKDLGRWKPIDDLALIIGIQQTNDLRMVHRGVKFSCKFSLPEMQARWYSLLFEPAVSRIAVSAMRNLHPELIESVQRKALFSIQEEELLGTVKSAESPKLEVFQELLDKHAAVFYCARTAKSLHNHWMLMKRYSLLPDQTVKPAQPTEQPLTFSDAEEQIFDPDLQEQRDEALEMELTLADRQNKREIRLLENELSRWGVLVDSVLGATAAVEFDNQTLACLRGRLVRYLMRSKEITFGREAKDYMVDVDLSLEGAAAKISRRQGTIKLRSNGDFFISNEGKRAIFINGVPLTQGNKTRLAHNCTVEIAGLSFAFLVNYELINAIRQESAKTPNPLN